MDAHHFFCLHVFFQTVESCQIQVYFTLFESETQSVVFVPACVLPFPWEAGP